VALKSSSFFLTQEKMKYSGKTLQRLLTTLLLIAGLCGYSQGTIQGTVVDATNGETLIGANVYLTGTTHGTMAEFDGSFSLKGVPAGTHSLTCSFMSYETKILESVEVKTDAPCILNLSLSPEAELIDVAKVEARVDKSSSVHMEQTKKRSAPMMDYISSQEIQKTGDARVDDALKRIPGVSSVGSYVFVRGLSDRYIKTTLNGAQIPSIDPRRNSVSMDIFPTKLIDNLVVTKTATADLPADWSGAYISVETQDYPSEFSFQWTSSIGLNTNTTFKEILASERSKHDWLAKDDGSRAIPTSIASVDAVPNIKFSNYYEALVHGGFEAELADLGISGASDIGIGEGQTSIFTIINDLEGVNSINDIDGWLLEVREIENQPLSEMAQAFPQTWENQSREAPLNLSQSIAFGNKAQLFGRDLGYNVGIQYNRFNSYYENGTYGRYKLTGSEDENASLNTERILADAQGTENVNWSALLNLDYQVGENSSIGLLYMPNASGSATSRYQFGENPSDEVGLLQEQRTQQYAQRNMNIIQLRGDHLIGALNNAILDWNVSYTKGKMETPDFRVFYNSIHIEDEIRFMDPDGTDITEDISDEIDYLIDEGLVSNVNDEGLSSALYSEFGINLGEVVTVPDSVYSVQDNLYPSPTRFFRVMDEQTIDAKINLEIPIGSKPGLQNRIKFGYSMVDMQREYSEKRFSFVSNGLEYDGNPNSYFSAANMSVIPGADAGYLYLRDDTDQQNSYDASQSVHAFYGMIDYHLSPKLRVNTGIRVETTDMLLESAILAQQEYNEIAASEFRGSLDLADVLPSFNLTYKLHEKDLSSTNLRLAASRSVARPMFREKAPYSAFDFFTQEVITGAPELQRTLVSNLDLRIEHFPYIGEIFSMSLFYKHFTDPIEQVIIATAANVEITWENVTQAEVYGAEFEVRKTLGFIGENWERFGIGANLTLVKSKTTISEDELELIRATDHDHKETRPMWGQSPYIVNAIASYDNEELGLNMALSYNIQGPKLVLVTKGGTPDIYDQPRSNLDLTVRKRLGEHFGVGFKARNLMDPAYRKSYEYKNELYDWQSYTVGRTFSLSFTYRIN
jgi:TonB-dependent receptor